jgi:hypothetical protein
MTYKSEYEMIQADFNPIAGFNDSCDTPKTYKDVLKDINQVGWSTSLKGEFHSKEW